jgi:hypothetical protein
MKKYFRLSVVALFISAGLLATQGLSAQKRVIKVQGHPHEYLTRLHGGKEDVKARIVTGSTANINLADIECWAGGLDPTITSNFVDSAVLIVKWTDDKALERGDSILIWGYRWNTISIYNDPTYGPDTSAVHKYTIDMIRAVANYDCAFSALLQNTSAGNFAAGGFGYNFDFLDNFKRVPLEFDAGDAAADSRITFGYEYPNCDIGQGAVPYSVSDQVAEALQRSSSFYGGTALAGTGIIRHPFDADYGYPAYDYDYWKLTDDEPNYEWQSGWYNGYWAFYVKNQLSGNFTYPEESGIATHEITNHSVSGFVFAINMDYTKDMSGDYTARPCVCTCHPPVRNENVSGQRK